jgi:hypothetical protein
MYNTALPVFHMRLMRACMRGRKKINIPRVMEALWNFYENVPRGEDTRPMQKK